MTLTLFFIQAGQVCPSSAFARARGSSQQHCSGGARDGLGDGEADETSADEDCPIEPPPGYRLVWKRDNTGEKYFTQKRVKQSTEMVQTYVCDDATGRWYKRNIPRADLEKIQLEEEEG